MKFKEMKEKKTGDLDQLEAKLRKNLADLRLQARTGQLAKMAQMTLVRRDIARVLTAKRQVRVSA